MEQSTPPLLSEWDQLRAQLREEPVDADTWLKLVALAEASRDLEKIEETYEGMLQVYPNVPSVHIAYLNHFLDDPAHYPHAEALFKRFLAKSASSVEVFKVYLGYMRRIKREREVMQQCYQFALTNAGQDMYSYEIWQEFIKHLKAGEAPSSWDEQQKMFAIRRAYQQAVQIPLENVERLWEDYQEFESKLDKITAKKSISDLQVNHMQARIVLNQLQEHISALYAPSATKGSLPTIWLPRPPTFNPGDKTLISRWRQYLKWEESNPLEIEDSNRHTFIQRVQAVYKKACVRMRYYSEIWYMAYVWTCSIGKTEEAVALLKAGIEANPGSFVLNYAYAEQLERHGNFAEVHAVFAKFLKVLSKDLEALEAKVNSANSSAGSVGSQQGQPKDGQAMDVTLAGLQSHNSSFNTQCSGDRPQKNEELTAKRTDYGNVWIVYIRFARRAQGLQSARTLFGKARRDRLTPWQVHEAEALMEYHCGNKDVQVASRIFEKGMTLFGDEVEYVLRYLHFLISINDENNARALFERVIGTFPPEKARQLWDRWARYEYQYGDLATAQKLEKRMADVYPNDPPIKRFAEKHKYMNIDSIATRDLGFVFNPRSAAARPSKRSVLLTRTDTVQSIVSESVKTLSQSQSSSSKRASSPDHSRRHDDSRDYPSKRARPGSPPRGRDRDKCDGPSHRRHGSPMYERNRECDGLGRFKDEREDKGVQLPGVISEFIVTLPAANTFDGPVFCIDDLMQLLRNALIPSSSSVPPCSPPPPPRSGGRAPPDYRLHRGPKSGRRGRW
ncbi:hypothetical protein C8Q76DRAFT_764545 [Earliella scabrosa]|nr:hypothetical protein C8Q76DRAFT_764545 [Earliella scabrosa]